ncbi:hypothetical protein CLOP_g16957 [Closterium sp. NIES-67]|nr:hypothetical protein CLOP_g16957 [Closterium sp. NIES-67]
MAPRTPQQYFDLLCSGQSCRVCESEEKGRAVVATRGIAEGEAVLATAPVVSHPTLDHVGKVCCLCLGPLAASRQTTGERDGEGTWRGMEEGTLGRGREGEEAEGERRCDYGEENGYDERLFCSKECADVAWDAFYAVERAADWSELHQHCRTHSLRFPLVAKRLACMVLAGGASANVLQPLCHVADTGGAPIPATWQQEHGYIHSALSSVRSVADRQLRSLSFFTPHWYASVIARLHLNAFRISPLPSVNAAVAEPTLIELAGEHGFSLSSAALFRAASAAVKGDEGVGTGVYLLASFFNHDCDPNVDISWPSDATAVLRARRDIEAGEHLTITYLDSSLGRKARQRHLKEAYGFDCNCQRCQQGD